MFSSPKKVLVVLLSLLTISFNGIPLVPMGFLIVLGMLKRGYAEPFKEVLHAERAIVCACAVAALLGVLVLQVSVGIEMTPSGTMSCAAEARFPGHLLTGFRKHSAKSEWMSAPRWIAYDVTACPAGDVLKLRRDVDKCNKPIRLARNTPVRVVKIINDMSPSTVFAWVETGGDEAPRTLAGVDVPVSTSAREHDVAWLITPAPPVFRDQFLRDEFLSKIDNAEIATGMNPHEVQSVLGWGDQATRTQDGSRMRLDYPARVLVFNADGLVGQFEPEQLAGERKKTGVLQKSLQAANEHWGDVKVYPDYLHDTLELHSRWVHTEYSQRRSGDVPPQLPTEDEARQRALELFRAVASRYDGVFKLATIKLGPYRDSKKVSQSLEELRPKQSPTVSGRKRKQRRKR